MRKVVLANSDYRNHMTDEGNQLQEGLCLNGWKLAGFGYDGIIDAKRIIAEYRPDMIFVHDKRDWDRNNHGCFNPRVHFDNIQQVGLDNSVVKVAILKDAATVKEYQEKFICDELRADIVAAYYHLPTVKVLCPRVAPKNIVRIYHTIDRFAIPLYIKKNKGSIVSGALSDAYPLRQSIVNQSVAMGIEVLKHPGYSNAGCRTLDYMKTLAQYKVSVATASRYGFALRKIIESVACECVTVTNLPKEDCLPLIDPAIIRITDADVAKPEILRDILRREEANYSVEKARYYSAMCKAFYDYRIQSGLFDRQLEELCYQFFPRR